MRKKRRIVRVTSRIFGPQYQVEELKKFLFFKYWSATHLFDHLPDAEDVVEYLYKQEEVPSGTIVKEYE